MGGVSSSIRWISHRGLGFSQVENTVEAFRAAVAAGFPVLETDLRRCRDGHIVLCHDPDLGRVAGDPRRIDCLTRSELEGIALPGGTRMLFFDAFAREFDACDWVLDIKPAQGRATIDALLAWAAGKNGRRERLLSHARFLFWNASQERYLLQHLPGAICYARQGACFRAGLSLLTHMPFLSGIRKGATYALTPRFAGVELFQTRIVEAYHRRGAKVLAFLPRTREEVERAICTDCDEILTNGLLVSIKDVPLSCDHDNVPSCAETSLHFYIKGLEIEET